MPELDTTEPATAEQLAKALADKSAAAEQHIGGLRDALRLALQTWLPDLRTALAEQRVAYAALLEHVTEQGPAAYPKGARRQTAHGITYGWELGKPSIDIPDPEAAIAACREHFTPADAAAVINTKETLRLDALAGWTDADLAKINARRVPAEDKPFVRGAVDDVEKLARAIGDKALKQLGEAA